MRGWLTSALRVLGVSAGCPTPAGQSVQQVAYTFPKVRAVSAEQQAASIIEALQEEGLTGVVPRAEILDRYQEHCLMLGFRPISTNAVFEALGKVCKKKRVTIEGSKVTAYVIAEPPVIPWPPLPENVVALPNGNKQAEIPVKHLVSARSGASAYAQA